MVNLTVVHSGVQREPDADIYPTYPWVYTCFNSPSKNTISQFLTGQTQLFIAKLP